MKLFLMMFVVLGFVAGPARADRWDSSGWVKLGEREVNGRYDHDKIDVPTYEGEFTKLTLYVEKSDLELLDFEITFHNGEKFHPEVRHVFKEGSRTRVIDLPGDTRRIKTINLRYKNIPGGGRAKVEVWGLKPEPKHAEAPPPVWESKGWVMLGERTVNGHGKEDHDTIEVGANKGRFKKMTIVVENADMEMTDFSVKFVQGAPWHPDVKHFFKEGQRTRVIDFPGDERMIKHIEFAYRNIPGEGHAKVAVWAQ